MNLGSDIRIKGSFFSHYKTLKLAKRLGWEGPIRLQQLWFFAAENRPDGDLCNMDDDDIALASGWMQETETFVSALVDCSWLDGEPGARSLHDYQEHQPWVQERIQRQTNSAKGGRKAAASLTPEERAERARHAASARWSDAESVPSECLDDAKSTKHSVSIDAECAKHGMLAPDQTIPNHTIPNHTIPIPGQEEEKTRDAGAGPAFSLEGDQDDKPKKKRKPKPKPLSKFDWPATKKILEATLEPDLYARWIEPLTYEGMSERGAVLVAADQYAANHVWHNMRDPLGDAILLAHGIAVPFCCLSRSSLAGAGS